MFEDFCIPPEHYQSAASGAMEADRPPGTWHNTHAEIGWANSWHNRQRGFPVPQNINQTRSPPGTDWPAYRVRELVTQGGPLYHPVGDTTGYLPRAGAYSQGFVSTLATYAPFTGTPFRQWPILGPHAMPPITHGGFREVLGSQSGIRKGGRGNANLRPRFTALDRMTKFGEPQADKRQLSGAQPSYTPGDFQAFDDGTGGNGEGYFL